MHQFSLSSVFSVRMKKVWVFSYPKNAQRRLRSAWASAQADLSPRLAHNHFVYFSWHTLTMASTLNYSFFIFASPGLATWHEPTGGMFLWMKFTGLDDSFPLITDRLAKRNVLLLPGKAFHVSTTQPSPCARISYALLSEEKMDKVWTPYT